MYFYNLQICSILVVQNLLSVQIGLTSSLMLTHQSAITAFERVSVMTKATCAPC